MPANERATADEVCHYFQEVMDETFLPSGQVDFRPMSDVQDRGDGTAIITNRLTGPPPTCSSLR